MQELIFLFLSDLSTFTLFLFIGLSLYVLGKGADLLVDQAVAISIRWGIPKVIVGATIVSLGTTIPEATVSVLSSVKGNPDLALGNAVGSIIANTALILGVSSLLGKIPVDKNLIKKQGRFLLLISIMLALFSMPNLVDKSSGLIGQWVGFFFLILLAYYLYKSVKAGQSADLEENDSMVQSNLLSQLLGLVIGLFLVILSSNTLIPSVEIVATRIGIPQAIIASTLVAFGTSLPELVTAITSVKKGHGELAIGNIIGANILNILLVIGLSAAVSPSGLVVDYDFYKIQIPTMLIALVFLYVYGSNEDGEISSKEGIFLIILYSLYLILNYVSI